MTGASGFLGRALVAELSRQGVGVAAMVRRSSDTAGLNQTSVELRYADLRDAEAVERAARGVSAVFHLGGATDVTDEQLNHEINVVGSQNLVDACHAAGCKRVLFVSSTCSQRALRDAYGETKRQAERVFDASGLSVTTFRPTMIYGPGSKEFGIFVSAIRSLPFVPLIAGGEAKIRPSFRDDAVAALIAAWRRSETSGRTYDIAGREAISFRELALKIAAAEGRRRKVVAIPRPLALLGARFLGALMEHPPINVDQVMAFLQDTEVDISAAEADLDFSPRPLAEGLPLALAEM